MYGDQFGEFVCGYYYWFFNGIWKFGESFWIIVGIWETAHLTLP